MTHFRLNPQLMQTLLDVVPSGIIVTQGDGTILYANNHAAHLLGYDSCELIGASILERIHNEDCLLSVAEVLEHLSAGGNTSTVRLEVAQRDGGGVLCDLTLLRVSLASGDERVIVTLHDISEELEHAEVLEKKSIEIAKMNSELIRSNTQLKRVSEMKSNFLSIASHELKTPLTSIKGYSDIIIDTMENKLDSGVYRMVSSINRAADRLHRVVNNILDVTRIEQKRLRLKPETIDLGAVALDCIDELSQFSGKRGITFVCDFARNLPPFYGDKMRMQQVFTNLLSNALKYSPDHSSITVCLDLQDEETLRICVMDTGIGINHDEQKKIFHPFYEVGSINRHSTDAAKFLGGGTGLGLSIVKGIVERHGGRIWVVSEGVREGEFPGSAFYVALPVRPTINWDDDETRILPDPFAVAEEHSLRPEPETNIDTKPVILLIDSDREAVEIASMVLENVFEVLVAPDGETGLRMAFESRPSLILLDSYLPGIDGYRICRILRTQDETRSIPVAFFSAGTQNDEIQQGFLCGADDFIVKPFGGRELVEKIWRLLMRKKERDNYS